jgi:cellulose synthase operon protein C
MRSDFLHGPAPKKRRSGGQNCPSPETGLTTGRGLARRWGVWAFLCLFIGMPAWGAEPYLEFVEGLRQRRYYDFALEYLDQIEARDDVPDEVRQVVPYERAQTLLSSANELTNLDAQRKQLDAAQASFEQFVRAHEDHRLAGRANTARGRILLEKARVDIWDGDKPSNEGSREQYREKARENIELARKIFEQARDQHKAAWEAFPTFIPEEERQRRRDRDDAEAMYMEALLDLAQCTYWMAQTYDRDHDQRKELLNTAADEFEAIHQQYRSQVGGLFARVWQGKCYEEQDEIRIALGIYGEILDHPGRGGTMRNLKDRALRFRLICLNHENRKDFELAVIEAEEWLREAGARARTDVGMGIQWELARAREALGLDRTRSDSDRRNHLTQALNRARAINRYPGELKTPSSAMIQRVMLALDREPGDPRDFDTAYGSGGQLYEEVQSLNIEINKAKAAGKLEEALQIQESQQGTAGEMARMYDLALRFVTPETDAAMVNIARLRLAYGYLLQKRYLDAAVVAEHQMTKFGEKFPEVGREAGFLAMASYDYAYNEASENDRRFEGQMVIRIAEKIAERWPDSDRANDARNTVARIHFQAGELLEAADWWLKIPQGSSQYADARIKAGKAYWRQYVIQAGAPEEERTATPDDLTAWKEAAIEHLTAGIDLAEKKIPEDAALPDDLVGAKLTLVNIRNLDGDYEAALVLLTQDPHPILKQVDVPKGEKRPRDSGKAKSREIASFAYQQLLRAQIGLKDLEKAREARKKMEEVAGGEDDAALTQIFVEFGRELEQELERLKVSGEESRVDEVRAGFEDFLNDLFNREDGQTFYSLLWIAETFSSLGEGSKDNPAMAEEFYTKAADAYRRILEKAESDPNFVSNPQQVTACKLRLVNSLRRQRDYAAGEQVVMEVLQTNPNLPDAQFEAARLYQDWGTHGGADDLSKFEIALYGKKEPVHVWGWAYTARALADAVSRKPDERLEELHFDARYHFADAQRLFAKTHPDLDEGTKLLQRAQATITGFQRTSKRWPDEEYMRFNSLYKGILADMGSPVADLPRELADSGGGAAPVEPATAGGGVAPGGGVPGGGGPGEPGEPETKGAKSNALLILLMLLVGAGAVAGLYFVSVGQSKKKYAAYAGKKSAALSREPKDEKIVIPAPASGRKRAPASAQGKKPASGTKTASPTATQKKRPATGKPGAPPQRKPRPSSEK